MTVARTQKPANLRCAVYTRKSTEDGLEQEFNSLDAQRDACEAYVKSQAGEGWELLASTYDDGGYSGGNMERPGLGVLLDDVDAGKVDIIVVYKVDRLTRSLMDFARIVERLDARGASFVSVTQAFNTTTSMGRLTLNVLLSFAQFEREVTGERIRDKIAASKAKGIWMGGNVPLGYDLGDRRLIVNENEAKLVRYIYRRYLELCSVPALARELREQGILSKCRLSRRGNEVGGKHFSCGALYHLLQNRLYRGKLVHGESVHQGQHDAIVDKPLFDQVQQQLADNRRGHRRRRRDRVASCPLTGVLFDAEGVPMGPSFGYGRGGKRYRYYVSASLLPGRKEQSQGGDIVRRIPADPLENLILGKLGVLFGSTEEIDWSTVNSLLTRVDVGERSIALLIDPSAIGEEGALGNRAAMVARLPTEDDFAFNADGTWTLICGRGAIFRGGKMENGSARSEVAGAPRKSPAFQLLRQSHRFLEQNSASPFHPAAQSGARAAADQRTRRIMAVGLLAPDLQRQLLASQQPEIVGQLLQQDLPLRWDEQRRYLGI